MIVVIIGILLVVFVIGLISRRKGDGFLDTLGSGCGGIIVIGIIAIGAIVYFINSSSESSNSSNSPSENSPSKSQSENSPEADQSETSKRVSFKNNSSSSIYLSWSCFKNSTWTIQGWMAIEPGESWNPNLSDESDQDRMYWFAYSNGGDKEWEGGDKYFLVDQFSDGSFKVVDGTVVEDGGGNKVQKGFNELSFGSSFTFE